MTAERTPAFTQEEIEEARRERLQDQGVGNSFEANVRVGTGEIPIQQALGYVAGRSLKQHVEDVQHPERIPHAGPELHEPLTPEQEEAKRMRNEEKRMYFIDSRMRPADGRSGVSYLQALALSVKYYGPLPRRTQDQSAEVA